MCIDVSQTVCVQNYFIYKTNEMVVTVNFCTAQINRLKTQTKQPRKGAEHSECGQPTLPMRNRLTVEGHFHNSQVDSKVNKHIFGSTDKHL